MTDTSNPDGLREAVENLVSVCDDLEKPRADRCYGGGRMSGYWLQRDRIDALRAALATSTPGLPRTPDFHPDDRTTDTMTDKDRGLYNKFQNIERTDGRSEPGEKHHGCEYFVLDLIPAIQAYANSCRADYPKLAVDILRRAGGLARDRLDALHEIDDGQYDSEEARRGEQ